MSYVIYLWEAPAGQPLPATIDEAMAQVDALRDCKPGPNPKFSALAARLREGYPGRKKGPDGKRLRTPWRSDPVDGEAVDAVLNLGLVTRLLDKERPFVISAATELGLCVMDEQAGEAFLAGGRFLTVRAEPGENGAEAYRRGDYTTAMAVMRPLAAQGNLRAQLHVAAMYFNGLGVARDFAEAARWYKLGVEANSVDAMNVLGVLYRDGKGVKLDAKEAVRLFKVAAKAGYARAQYNLGLAFHYGEGVSTDREKAFAMFLAAAEQGERGAQFMLGCAYDFGKGVEKNPGEALKWYRRSAEQGNVGAALNLGLMYRDGEGTEPDYGEASKWFRVAAEKGDAQGQNQLGRALMVGSGCEQNESEGVHWLRLSADQGHSSGQYALSTAYQDGLGVTGNLVVAYALRQLVKRSDPSAYGEINPLRLASGQTMTQVVEGGLRLVDEIAKPGNLLKAIDAYVATGALPEPVASR